MHWSLNTATLEDGSWIVKSQSGCNPKGYRVSVIHSSCHTCSPLFERQDARVCTAAECSYLCPHMYECDPTCYVYNNGHMCKHIHRVHSLVKNPDLDHPHDGDMCAEVELSYAESVFNPEKG